MIHPFPVLTEPRKSVADGFWSGTRVRSLRMALGTHRACPKYMSSQIALSANSSTSASARKYCTRHSPLKRR